MASVMAIEGGGAIGMPVGFTLHGDTGLIRLQELAESGER
jgi:hypothetical protein